LIAEKQANIEWIVGKAFSFLVVSNGGKLSKAESGKRKESLRSRRLSGKKIFHRRASFAKATEAEDAEDAEGFRRLVV
jgi:hypothetical protein